MKGQDPHPRAGQGLLVIWNDIEAGHEAEFREWHTREHMPERLAIPGFLHGRRLFSPTATPRWLTLYETASPDVLRSPAYLERLDAPSAWMEFRLAMSSLTSSDCAAVLALIFWPAITW